MHPVALGNGKVCLVVCIPRRWARPHAVVNGGEWLRFHARTSSGKYRLDVPEVRATFLATETTAERMRAFRADRLAAIGGGDTPVPLPDKPRLVYHCIPADAFELGINRDLPALAMRHNLPERPFNFAPYFSYNFDGLLMYEQEDELRENLARNGYVQAYSDGVLEAVVAREFREGTGGGIKGFQFENIIVGHVNQLRKTLAALGVDPPVFVFVSLLGLKGSTVYASVNMADEGNQKPIDRDLLLFVGVTLEDEAIQTEHLLKPVFDRLWRASGWPGSPSYGDGGLWDTVRRQRLTMGPWG